MSAEKGTRSNTAEHVLARNCRLKDVVSGGHQIAGVLKVQSVPGTRAWAMYT